ncbi:RNA polymerase sigma factor [Psychroserpens sp.]|uniref:RNA polymerase sigma factor n=1 Tax=Psychroserpens sp. TaxID=2020870 RepID=UPI00385EE158
MKHDRDIDEELVLAYQAGNKKAMAKLVKRWHLTFCKKAYWVVKDASLSKDIAQDSWQTIIAKLDALNKPSSFKSWALRIVYTKAIDTLREDKIMRNKEAEYKNEDVYEIEEMDDLTVLKKKLLDIIKSLPEHQQMVLKLFYTEGYSLKEISILLNISVGTTKSRLFHAREKLKSILKPIIAKNN